MTYLKAYGVHFRSHESTEYPDSIPILLLSTSTPYTADPILKKKPELHHLMSWLVTLQPNWRQVGQSLKVAEHQLESFDQQRGSNAIRLSNTFDEWRRSMCSPYTFEQLISSLKQRGYNEAIETVKEKLQDREVRRDYSL